MVEERGPYVACNFEVELDGRSVGFSEVRGLGFELEDADDQVRRRVNAVPLRRALVGDPTIWRWVNGSGRARSDLRTVRITLLDAGHEPVCSWELRGARPVAWSGPTLNAAAGSELATEELVIVAEEIDYNGGRG